MKQPTFSTLGNFFPKLKANREQPAKRPYHTAQIELTSRCSTGCLFCPHQALVNDWISGDMPVELYQEHIAPHLGLFDLVYLQGWGEPMLHRHHWDMLKMAKQKGCQTGFTTNGSWLQRDNNEKIIDSDVDLISVSFAGTDASMHESLRTNSKFAVLCENFEDLANLKKKTNASKPWLELHFLMTRRNLGELPGLVELASRLGADEVVATNLAYSPSLELDGMHVFSDDPLLEDLDVISDAEQRAAQLNMPLRVYPLRTQPETLVCDADPLNSVYINHKGEVSACVYLGITVQGQVPRFFHGESHPIDVCSFGNVRDGMELVLDGELRQEFITAFKHRNISSDPLALFTFMAGRQEPPALPSPPAPCQYCYKMLGI
jgi:MoaA/NifB/PqqE/SkfB family radical SAM enzyme